MYLNVMVPVLGINSKKKSTISIQLKEMNEILEKYKKRGRRFIVFACMYINPENTCKSNRRKKIKK